MSCLGLYHVQSSLACHVYFMLCSIVSLRCFCLSFELYFLIHLAPLMHHLLPLFIFSFLYLLPLDSFVYSWQKGGEYTGVFHHFYMTHVHTGVFCHFYRTHVHILRRRNSTSCTFIGGKNHRGDAYTKGKKTFLFFFRKPCFALCVFSRCFMVL